MSGERGTRNRAQPGNSEAILVPAEPIDPQVPPGVAVDLEKAHLQHHLLRGGDLHRVDHRRVRREALGHLDRPRRRDRVARLAAQHHLAVRARDMDAPRSRGGQDIAVQRCGVGRHLEVDDGDQPLVRVEHRNVGGADLLALDIEGVVGHRQEVGDLRRADHRGGERVRERERLRLVERHREVTDRGAFDDLRPGRRSTTPGENADRGRGHDGPGHRAAEARRPPPATRLAVARQRRPPVVRHFGSLQPADFAVLPSFYALPLRPDASRAHAITGHPAARRIPR